MNAFMCVFIQLPCIMRYVSFNIDMYGFVCVCFGVCVTIQGVCVTIHCVQAMCIEVLAIVLVVV